MTTEEKRRAIVSKLHEAPGRKPAESPDAADDFSALVEKRFQAFQRAQSDLYIAEEPEHDSVNHPAHYTSHPSGVECIQITEHMGFNLGNALKYIWRADLKGSALEDLEKARWYVEREIARRRAAEVAA